MARGRGSGTVLRDLDSSTRVSHPPNNIDPTVTVGGMSVFEMIIQLRDDLVRGDQELVGGRDLGCSTWGSTTSSSTLPRWAPSRTG
jgi:hypothetical protein